MKKHLNSGLLVSLLFIFSTEFHFAQTTNLLTPENAATNVYLNQTFEWSEVAGATYHLQISSTPQFWWSQVDVSNIPGTSYQVTGLFQYTSYYWRVGTNTGSGYVYTSPRSFTTGAQLEPDNLPVLLTPANGSTDIPATYTFSWQAIQNATYNLQISTTSNFSVLYVNRENLSSTSFQVTTLAYSTNYYWRVLANDGTTNYTSEVWSFTTGLPGGGGSPNPGPTLISPSNSSTDIATNHTFLWNVVDSATSYQIQVATSQYFGIPQIDQTTSGTSFTASGLYLLTPYYWRVKATKPSGDTDWSDTWSFTTSATPPAIPNTPILSSPANNSTGVNTSPSLSWNASSGAASYRLQVSTSSAFATTIVDESNITLTNYNLSSLLNSTQYYWRVNATNSEGTSGWSSVWNFTTESGVLPPVLVVTSPVDNLLTNTSPVNIDGNVDDPSNTVKVNGSNVTVNGDGTFSTTINLNEGLNTINITAYNSVNDSDVVVRNVTLDTSAPILTINEPADSSVTNIASVNVSGNVSDGIVTVNGDTVVVDGSGNFTTSVTLVEGGNTITVEATDEAGNVTSDSRYLTLDTSSPVLTITEPADSSITNISSVNVSGNVSDGTVTVNGDSVVVDGSGNFTTSVTLLEGGNTITIEAIDEAGNVTSDTRFLTLDTVAPALVISYPVDGSTTDSSAIHVKGVITEATGVSLMVNNDTAAVAQDGSFSYIVNLTEGNNVINLVVTDEAGNSTLDSVSVFRQSLIIPPDPVTIAPPLDTTSTPTMIDAVEFLFTGPNPIQTGVNPDDFEPIRIAVLKGIIYDNNSNPVPGVEVTVLNHPELGKTHTRADGKYDIAVNGGGNLTLNYYREGYLRVQRTTDVPWQDYVVLEDVYLTQLDTNVTTITFTDSIEVARGSVVTDNDGTRQATMLFEQGTQAVMKFPDGSTQPISTLNVRATEYTIGDNGPEAMPAPLPPATAYTYCVELSVDEAINNSASSVEFSKPVVLHVDNFLDFPVGIPVPVGYYNYELGKWVAMESGQIIKITDIQNGVAQIDWDGDNVAEHPDSLLVQGITLAEAKELAGLYSIGNSLWRIATPHFSPLDANWGRQAVQGSENPNQENGKSSLDGFNFESCTLPGSIIGVQDQFLGERISLTGTPFTLNYNSKRTKGYTNNKKIIIPVSEGYLPDGVLEIVLNVDIAGINYKKVFQPEVGIIDTFTWDGKDAYGREFKGAAKANIKIDYIYRAVYVRVNQFGFTFPGIPIDSDNPRSRIALSQEYEVTLINPVFENADIGNWTISDHHTFDPKSKVLFRGDGTQTTSEDIFSVMSFFAGNGSVGSAGIGGQAADANLNYPNYLTSDIEGNIYISDAGGGFGGAGHRILKITKDGIIERIAGTQPNGGYNGDGISASSAWINSPQGIIVNSAGEIIFADAANYRIRKIDNNGIITTIAGTGTKGYSANDFTIATETKLGDVSDLALAPDGSIYFAENYFSVGSRVYYYERVRKIDTRGLISTYAGRNNDPDIGSNNPQTEVFATESHIRTPSGLLCDNEGNLYITQAQRILKITPDGIIHRFAGAGNLGSYSEGIHAYSARINPNDLVLNNNNELIFSEGTGTIRIITTDTLVYTIAGKRGVHSPIKENVFASLARFDNPLGMVFAPNKSIYIADPNDNRIRELRLNYPDYLTNGFLSYNIVSEDGSELYSFDLNGKHLKTTNTLTGRDIFTFEYNTEGQLSSIVDQYSRNTRLVFDNNNRVEKLISPLNQITYFIVDEKNHLKKIIQPSGDEYSFTYTDSGLLSTMKDPRGNDYVFSYDNEGFLTSDVNPAGSSISMTRQEVPDGFKITTETAEGRKRTYQIETTGNDNILFTNTSENGLATTTLLSRDGITTTTRPDGTTIVSEKKPDPQFELQAPLEDVTITTPGGLTLSTTRDKVITEMVGEQVTSISDTISINGNKFVTDYDGTLNTFTSTTPEGRITTTTVDTLLNPISTQVPGILPVNYTYNSDGFITNISQGTRSSTFGYDDIGRLTSLTDPMQRNEYFEYDSLGRMTRQVLPNNDEILYTYDQNGNLTSLTPPGRSAHTFVYTSGNLNSDYIPPVVPDSTGALKYVYNLDKQLTHVIRSDSSFIHIEYDSASCNCAGVGKPSAVHFDRGTVLMEYDTTSGNLSTLTTPENNSLAYTYDGSLPLSTEWTGAVNGKVDVTYDNNFRVVSQSVSNNDTINYTYDNDGILTSAGALTINSDAQNGLLTGTSIGSVSTGYSYNTYGEVTGFTAQYNTTDLFATNYTLDSLGRITTLTETIDGVTNTFDYTYSSIGFLTQVERNDTIISQYIYDSNGNRTHEITINDQMTGYDTTYVVYDAQDRLLQYGNTFYGYTSNGSLRTKIVGADTTGYVYDDFGNLTNVTLPPQTGQADGTLIDYIIDGQNRRIAKKVNGIVTNRWLYQDQLNPIAELDSSGNVVARYVYGTKINVPDYIVLGDTTLAVITDHLGSVRMLVNTANGDIVQRIDYDEFGNEILSPDSYLLPFSFAGGHCDEDTELIRFGARDFDPVTARWNTKDPLLFGAGQANLFMYCGNDPINRLDPSGLQDFMCINAGEDFWEWLQKALGFGGDPSENDPTVNDRPYAGVDENVARFQYDAFQNYIILNANGSLTAAALVGTGAGLFAPAGASFYLGIGSSAITYAQDTYNSRITGQSNYSSTAVGVALTIGGLASNPYASTFAGIAGIITTAFPGSGNYIYNQFVTGNAFSFMP